jgi:NADH:ubiquinone reductase (non-electrogenic)
LLGITTSNPEFTLKYDLLVVAVGARNNTYNTPGVEQYCHFLKSVNDVRQIRNRIVDCLETASIKGQSEDDIKRLLHFVVVGGGPTGKLVNVIFLGQLISWFNSPSVSWCFVD